MFGIDSGELLIIAIVALVVIGPKDLPRVMRAIGNFVGKARGMARHFRTGIDAMVREVEMEELEKKWADQNRRIMQEHPPEASSGPAVEPLADTSGAAAPTASSPPPFVAQSAPVAPPSVAPAPAAEGPPYIAAEATPAAKGDAQA